MRTRIAFLALLVAVACGSDDEGAKPSTSSGGSSGTGGAGGNAGTSSGGVSGSANGGTGGGGSPGASRGYFTSATELASIKARAEAGDEPYATALEDLISFAGSPTSWSFGSIAGDVTCGGSSGGSPDVPEYIANTGGGPLVLAKAYLFHLTGDEAFATEARARILELTTTTGWGGDVYSGATQCILNLSWFVPRFIQAADLLEGWSGWSAADKAAFGGWLATEVYPKTSWSSANRINNWGSGGSLTSAMIADYLVGSAIELTDEDGTTRTLAEAWTFHRDKQRARMDGSEQMDSECPTWGIEAHGGIPDELRRGTSGCAATYILEEDASYTYQLTHIQSLVAHAEVLLRRGSAQLFDNVAANDKGSIQQSILFVIDNPQQSWPWTSSHLVTLEIAYRQYREAHLCAELACDDPGNRVITDDGNRVLSFTTLTHGFSPEENPGPPPSVPPPG
jgi:hypothetical protein